MATKRKTTTAIVAGVTALALLLGGTFAWTSISQQAKNEAIVDINPGGRLHDDFNGTNKDVYVENFSSGATGVNIFARIRLDQYFEVGQDAGINKENGDRKVNKIFGDETDINDVKTWVTYKPGDDLGDTSQVQANDNWQWNLGREDEDGELPYYMPTFNKNKDSLKADINGTYEGTTEGDIVHYDDYKEYGADSTPLTQDAIYDWDEDTDDEENPSSITDRNLPIDSADVLKESETHEATQISTTANVISMADWLALPADEQIGNFWVYDEDGWAYWANYIAPGETTGLLLDSINMSRVPDDNYYYGINVVGQFATASDWELLYTPAENGGGGSMTEEAKTLMELITATNSSTEDGGEDDDNTDDNTYDGTLTLNSTNSDVENVNIGSEIPVEFDATDIAADATQPDISDVTITYDVYNEETEEYDTVTLEKDKHYTYTYDADSETGSLTILDETLIDERLNVKDKNNVVMGDVDVTEYVETETAVITIDWYQPNAEGYIYLDAVTTQVNEYTVYVDDSFDLASLTATEATGVTFTPDIANKTATLTISPFAWDKITITATDVNGETETVYVVPRFDTIKVTPSMDGTTMTLRPGPYGLVAEDFTGTDPVVFTIEAIGDDPITRCVILNNSGAYSLSVATAETATSLALVATQGETVVKITLNLVNTEPSLAPDFAYIDQGELTGMAFEENTYVVSFKAGHDYLLNTSVPHTFEGTVLWSVDETAPAYFGDGTDTTKKESDAVNPRDGLVQIHIAEDAIVGSTFVMTVQLTETGADDGMPAVYAVQVTIVAADAEIE